ncbi:MAG: hypothetical protein QXT64_05030 [Desulfurococcaceae archaeon]
MSRPPPPEKILLATCLGDALTTTTAYYMGLPEAGLLPRLLLPLVGPAYFILQYIIMYSVIKAFIKVFNNTYAPYPLLLMQAMAVGNNLGWLLRWTVWS